MSLHKTHICVVKSLVKIAAVSWHSLRRFVKPAPGRIYSFDVVFPVCRSNVDSSQLVRNVQLIAEVLAQHIFDVDSAAGVTVFNGSLVIPSIYI